MPKAVVLLSGGLDSTTTLAIARSKGFECFALSVGYGQRHASELRAAATIAESLGAVEHRVMHVDMAGIGGSALTDSAIPVPEHPTEGVPVTYVPARNTIMLSLAMAWAEVLGAEAIFVGVNARDYSVGGDTKVWIRRGAEAQLLPIKALCQLPEGDYRTIAVDPVSLQLCWRRVTGRFAHKVGHKRCYRIILERGQQIDVSEDHSLFTIGDYGQILPIQGSQIDVGTPLVVPFELCDVRGPWEADLPSIDVRSTDLGSAGVRATTLVEDAGCLTDRSRRTLVPLSFPLTDDFLRIVGLWLAEGGKAPESASKSLAFSVGGLEGAPALLHRYFATYRVDVNKSPDNDYDYCVSSSVFHGVFSRLGLLGTSKTGTKRLPSWFWRLSQRQRRIVVAGLWDGDGGRVWNGEAPIYQKSHEIINDLYHCLLLDGIFATVKSGPRSQRRLAITRSTDMSRFAMLYPLWHAAKRQSLLRARSIRRKDKTTRLRKFAGIRNAVAAATLDPGLKTRIYDSAGEYDNSVRAQRSALAPVPMLTHLVECKLAFLRVAAIEPIFHEVMYDLSVEGAENFLANGFVAHNSGYPDCRPEFIDAFNTLAARATKVAIEGKPAHIEAPLIDRSKAEIIQMGVALGVDYSLTVSCYQADDEGRACGRCDSCRIRREGFDDAGIKDPTRYR